MDFYNVMRDPGEKYGALYPGTIRGDTHSDQPYGNT